MVKVALASLFLCLASLAVPLVQADISSYEFAEPEMAQRFVDLTTVLRCPKCQNQNLADSDSIIAKDLRGQLQMLIKTGQTDRQITDFMVQRYGEFILYDPPFNKGYTGAVAGANWHGACLACGPCGFLVAKPHGQGAMLITQRSNNK